jgi:hypothetical protein
MNNFLNFILMGNRMTIRPKIGGKNSWDERDGMIMDATGRGKFFGGGKNNFGRERIDWRLGCTKGVSTT